MLKNNYQKYIKFIKDIFINILSSSLLAISLQLIIFPFISNEMKNSDFGQLVAIYGINNLIVNFLGNSLNNTRLLSRKNSNEYSLILYIINILSSVLILISANLMNLNIGIINIFVFMLFTLLANNRNYFMVNYRLSLEYNKIFILNIFVILGYFLGFIIYIYTKLWSVIFLSGEIIALMYMIKNKTITLNLSKNQFKYNKVITVEFIKLSFANFINNFLNYLDRFLIIPLLGSVSMGVYFAASAISKIIVMLLTPINNVLLSYITNRNILINKIQMIKVYLISLLLIVPLYFIINISSELVVEVLYKDFAYEAKTIIPIITIGILFNTITNVNNNLLISKYPIMYQILIQIIYGLIYIILSIVFTINYGLKGFAYSFVLSNIAKYFTHILIIILAKQNKEVS